MNEREFPLRRGRQGQLDSAGQGEYVANSVHAVPMGYCSASTCVSTPVTASESYFDGGLLQLIGWKLLGAFITAVTCGICYPFAFCLVYRWEARHTVIDGKRLVFDGKAVGLFGLWIKWFLLCLITAGIYGLWIGISLKKWKVKHTYFAS